MSTDNTDTYLKDYNLAYVHGIRLPLKDRVRLCIRLLEPDCFLVGSALSRAVDLLKKLVQR